MNRVNEPIVALLPHVFLPLGLCPQLGYSEYSCVRSYSWFRLVI